MTTRQKWWITAAVAVAVTGTATTVSLWPGRQATWLATVVVTRSTFTEYQQIRGEIKAHDSLTVSAPFAAGDLQILTIAKSGTIVKKGDVIAQFDPTTVQRTLDQKRTELRSAEAQIQQSQAQAHLNEQQKITDLLAAEYDVERAKLDVSKQEIVSQIDAEKAKLVLSDNEHKMQAAETKKASGKQSGNADIQSMILKKRKAEFDVRIAEHQLSVLTLRAPADGMITISPNHRAGGMFSDNAPPFKAGDRAWSGAAIAEIPDLSSIRMLAHVDEIDRGRLMEKQQALVRVDAVPDREFSATISQISALGKPDFSTWPPPKNFDIVMPITDSDPRLRPGMSANARIVVNTVPNAIVVPAQAVFEKNGRTITYVLHGSRTEARVVTVASRSGSDVLIGEGLQVGERIALTDPTSTEVAKQ